MVFFWCCGGRPQKKKKRKSQRLHRRARPGKPAAGELATLAPKDTFLSARSNVDGEPVRLASITSEEEFHDFHDARDNFSEAGLSPVESPRTSADMLDHGGEHPQLMIRTGQTAPDEDGFHEAYDNQQHLLQQQQRRRRQQQLQAGGREDSDGDSASSSSGSSEFEDEAGSPGGFGRLLSCLKTTSLSAADHRARSPGRAMGRMQTRVRAGASLRPRDLSLPEADVRESWEDCEALDFKLRCREYMRSKQKVPCGSASFYQAVSADMFSFPVRANHLARQMSLPEGGLPVMYGEGLDAVAIPPLLIINIQLPMYAATLFGPNDGPNCSLVLMYKLREGFDPLGFPNQASLQLFKRFLQNGREEDGQPTRERLKLIARVVNVDEWAVKGPLSSTEHKLLLNYNEKPVLTRPQHHFFQGPNYLEVDVDIHSYAYLARKALNGFQSRLKEVVWEVAMVVQGNSPDELPEHVMSCTRMFRLDFDVERPFSDYLAQAEEALGSTLNSPGPGLGLDPPSPSAVITSPVAAGKP